MNEARETFTAAEIATAIGWSKPRVQTALQNSPRTATKNASGNEAPAWSIAGMPETLVRELERLQSVHRYRTAGDVLRNPTKPWQPLTPLARVTDADRRDAERLREALATALPLPEGTALAERARTVAQDYRRAFGYAVSARQLERLIARTLDRDRGAQDWQRLELFLSDAARSKAKPRASAPASAFGELEEELSTVSSSESPTPEDRSFCWRKVVEFFDSRAALDGANAAKIKRDLCAFLLTAAPFLAESRQAMKRNLNRKLSVAADEGVAALVDQRSTNSGCRQRPEDWDANIQLFAQWTLIRHGRESQAWRELHLGTTPTGDQFSEGFRNYFGFDVRTAKSRVPHSAREAIRATMNATVAHQRGPRAARLARPSIPRDWSDTAAGDYFTADDVTINHLWFEWHEFGEYEFEGQRFNVGRGQWLICCDERTDFPLGFLLMPSPTYNSAAICTLNARIFSDERVGLPFKGVRYELGVWKARKIAAQFSWPKISDAFARQGIELTVRHATTPRAKIVERVIGSAQNMMDHLPGYIGRCEQSVKFEREQKFLQSLKRVGQPRKAEVDPSTRFLSKEQISDELVKVMRAFAAEPQNGSRLAGLSPAEAWEQLSPARPHQVLPESLRYLLTTHQKERTVTNEGITLPMSSGRGVNQYFGSERLGELIGEKVRVYFNPELPELVSVIHPRTDPKAANPFSVPLCKRLPANTATAEDFAQAKAHQRAFSKFGADAFRLIAPPRNLTMRNEGLGTPELRETGDRLNEIESAQRGLQSKRKRHRGEIQQLATRHNLDIDPAKVRDPERVVSSLQRADVVEEEIRRMEAAAAAAENL